MTEHRKDSKSGNSIYHFSIAFNCSKIIWLTDSLNLNVHNMFALVTDASNEGK